MTDNFYLCGEDVSESEPYEYRLCGLKGIFLLNGIRRKEHDGEMHVSIKDIDGLHVAIGKHLVMYRKALSPDELRFLRRTLDLSQAGLGDVLGKSSQSVARWEKGENDIPAVAEKLLRAYFVARKLMSDEDHELLRVMLTETLAELDEVDELSIQPVQFCLTDHWVEEHVQAA